MYNKISRTLLENENKNRGIHTVFFSRGAYFDLSHFNTNYKFDALKMYIIVPFCFK